MSVDRLTTWYAGGPGFDPQHNIKLSVMVQPVSPAGGPSV